MFDHQDISDLSQNDKEILTKINLLTSNPNPLGLRKVVTLCSKAFVIATLIIGISELSPEVLVLACVGFAVTLLFNGYGFGDSFYGGLRVSDGRVGLTLMLLHLYCHTRDLNSPPNSGSPLGLLPLLKMASFATLRYATLLLAILSYCLKLHARDQADLQVELGTYLKGVLKQREANHRQMRLGIRHIQLLAEELNTTANVIHAALRNLACRGERSGEEGACTQPFGMVFDSSFHHISQICERLAARDTYRLPDQLEPGATPPTRTFPLSGLLQQVGDLLVELAARQRVELVINDADFAFRKILAYGEGVELHHLLHQVVRYAILSATAKSSVELGVKIPSPAQAQVDPRQACADRYPFIFQVSYSAASDAGKRASLDPLELIRQQLGAKITHFEGSGRKTVYVHCNLTLPAASSGLLHQQFDQLLEFHEEAKEIRNCSMVFISPGHSRFGVYIQSCWQLMGASLRACDCEPSALNKVLRGLGEKAQTKRVCIAVNGHFPSFQNVVHSLLLRSAGDVGRRSSVNGFSVIYLVAPNEYKRSTRFLETILSQCHSSFYPSVTIILKPVGFRRFASLFVAHAASRSPLKLQCPEPIPLPRPDARNPTPHPGHVGGEARLAQARSEVDISAPRERVPGRTPVSKGAGEREGTPAPPPITVIPDAPLDKPAFPPPSKLGPKGKHLRPASKGGKLNAMAKPSRKPRISPMLTPHMARRPGNNAGSYFPQVQSLPINVLIVEDNPINQKILATFMMKRKIKYSVANDGQEAVEKWKEGGFHIVLMDIQLPVMDGIEATKAIRQVERQRQIGFFSPPSTTPQSDPTPAPPTSQPSSPSPHTPPTPIQSPVIIVALTASSLRTDRIEALAAGCNDFLTKPVSLVWLEKKIMEWGCMQALIDVEGWRRLKYSRGAPRALGPSTAPTPTTFAATQLTNASSPFNMRSEAMLSKLKRAEERKRGSSPLPSL
ncbi:Two-component response regulator SSK1p [Massospora cicadina]|nr:Two-component response regulator SSK1p [Massospora cicadina]